MAAVVMSRCVFLHSPKCGGTWALSALRAQGIVRATILDPIGDTHPSLAQVREVAGGSPVITAVRDPVEWLRSFWRFFMARDWRAGGGEPFMAPLLSMASLSFQEFAQRYLHRRPGYITEVMRRFADGADHVCRQEHLLDDLAKALEQCGQPFTREVLEHTPKENISRRFEADCPKGVEDKIRKVDHWALDKFYA